MAYQEGTKHVEADKVEDGEAAAAGGLPFCAVVGLRLWSALLAWHAGQHDVLPGLPCGTPGGEVREPKIPKANFTDAAGAPLPPPHGELLNECDVYHSLNALMQS